MWSGQGPVLPRVCTPQVQREAWLSLWSWSGQWAAARGISPVLASAFSTCPRSPSGRASLVLDLRGCRQTTASRAQ